MTSTWVREQGSPVENGVFVLPMPPDGTVSDVVIHVGQKMYGSFVLESSEDDSQDVQGKKGGKGPVEPALKTRPGVFTVPVPEVQPSPPLLNPACVDLCTHTEATNKDTTTTCESIVCSMFFCS